MVKRPYSDAKIEAARLVIEALDPLIGETPAPQLAQALDLLKSVIDVMNATKEANPQSHGFKNYLLDIVSGYDRDDVRDSPEIDRQISGQMKVFMEYGLTTEPERAEARVEAVARGMNQSASAIKSFEERQAARAERRGVPRKRRSRGLDM